MIRSRPPVMSFYSCQSIQMNVSSYLLAHLLSSSPWHVFSLLCAWLTPLRRAARTRSTRRDAPLQPTLVPRFRPVEPRRARLTPCQTLILMKLVTALMQVTNKAVKTTRYKSSRLIAGDLGSLRASFLFRARRHSPVFSPSRSGWKNPPHSTLLNASLCLAHASGFSERCETFFCTLWWWNVAKRWNSQLQITSDIKFRDDKHNGFGYSSCNYDEIVL